MHAWLKRPDESLFTFMSFPLQQHTHSITLSIPHRECVNSIDFLCRGKVAVVELARNASPSPPPSIDTLSQPVWGACKPSSMSAGPSHISMPGISKRMKPRRVRGESFSPTTSTWVCCSLADLLLLHQTAFEYSSHKVQPWFSSDY